MVEAWTSQELIAVAGPRQRARTLVHEGAYVRVLSGVYVSSADDSAAPEVRVAALERVLPREVAVSHRSALWVLGEDVLARHRGLDITVARGRHVLARPGRTTHTAALPEHDLVDLDGLLVVCAARAADVHGRSPAALVARVRRAVASAASLDRSRVRRGPDTLRRPRLTPLPALDQLRGDVLPLARPA